MFQKWNISAMMKSFRYLCLVWLWMAKVLCRECAVVTCPVTCAEVTWVVVCCDVTRTPTSRQSDEQSSLQARTTGALKNRASTVASALLPIMVENEKKKKGFRNSKKKNRRTNPNENRGIKASKRYAHSLQFVKDSFLFLCQFWI